MDKNTVLEILKGWNYWEQNPNSGVPRDLYLEKFKKAVSTGQIIVVTGSRRSGKSYLLRQFAKSLISSGKSKNSILLVNFEDPRFIGHLDTNFLEFVYKTYLEYLNPGDKPTLFLDEIQNVANWEKWVRVMHELEKATIVVSGSNSKLLSQELATTLTGRHFDIKVFPLSFGELLNFRNYPLENDGIDRITLFREYLEFGGFPKVILGNEKNETLLSYFSDVVEKDLVKRYKIRKEEKIKSLGNFLLANVGNPVSFRALERLLDIAPVTAEKFLKYLESAFLTFTVKRFSYKVKEQEKSPRKIYSIDCGLANAVGFRFSENLGHLAENAVAIGLERKKSCTPNFDYFYWKDDRNNEVDFLVKEGLKVTNAIQVCWDFASEKIKEREIKPLLKAMKEFNLTEGAILTASSNEELTFGNKVIKVAPLDKYPIVIV